MQDQTQIGRRARQSEISSPAIRPETIPALACYLGITTETLSQLAALHYLRQRQAALGIVGARSEASLMVGPALAVSEPRRC